MKARRGDWEGPIRKSINEQVRERRIAAWIIEGEHGTKHAVGARQDLCRYCRKPPAPAAR